MPHRAIPSYQRQNARSLRRAMTDVERKLWGALRAERFAGVSFRRQAPIGPYIVDFVCHVGRLIIELDGGQHNEDAHAARDIVRERFLTEAGYRILRFWNFEVNSEFAACIDRLYLSLIEQGLPLEISGIASTPLPVPPPQGGRERPTSDLVSGVPSPLEGEGQGGGCVTHSIDPATPSPVSTP